MAIVILGIQTFCPKSSVMISHNIEPKITICWPEIKPKMVDEKVGPVAPSAKSVAAAEDIKACWMVTSCVLTTHHL